MADTRPIEQRGVLRLSAMAALVMLTVLMLTPGQAAAKYASLVIDADTGEVLHAVNSDTRNYPASLTKMMTLYKVFEAVKSGRWSMNTRLRMSARAAGQPPSKLGLKPGETISVRDAILALTVKSANDIASAVAENYSGKEREFALEMTATARRLGMDRTTFRNASGLPHSGQLSTARDMAKLARALLRDFPQYYHFFSRTRFDFDGVSHKTHNKLLLSYEGADGFKTGYIRASGFNLVTSAERDGRRLIGVVFGANSSSARNHLMTRFLDRAFASLGSAPVMAKADVPAPASLPARADEPVEQGDGDGPTRVVEFDKHSRWGIQVGAFAQSEQAESMAMKARDTLPGLLDGGVVSIVPLTKKNGKVLHRARVYGLTKKEAYRACKLLEKRRIPCMELRGPESLEMAALQS
ncbi:MAG: D-alanyl-D-alanine carboxypeptidase [Rhodospirillales bacterium CG15_BIG_FIL_POST_REV_8_21_14_020_66_15]|nr:MAG: D-alanyl-D-alanine carboxypeptidase [Rhodospirillales bacterium CG15_BIG_FIL_POST_REV_8_21_14_020_66_15]